MTIKINKYLFFLFISLFSCKGQSSCNCNLSKKYLSAITYEEALILNKQIIPCLIDSIDMSGTSSVGFLNPMSSYIDNYYFNQKGIKYAYLVDYILLKDSVEKVNQNWNKEEELIHWAERIKPYRVYKIGIIVKQDESHKPIFNPLTPKDMVEIKKMYLDWWKKSRNKSIETLRKEFRKGDKILKFPYVWI